MIIYLSVSVISIVLKHQRSQITIQNIIVMKNLEIFLEVPKHDTET